jgi:beta-lactamase regulating signal transducer with metallopeptidase domain
VSLLCLSLRRASASTLHAIWALGLIGALAVPLATTFLPAIDVPILPENRSELVPVDHGVESAALPTIVVMQEPEAVRTPAIIPSAPVVVWTWQDGLRLVWGLGSCVVFLGWLLALWQLHRAKTNSVPLDGAADDGWPELLHQLRSELGVSVPVSLRTSTKLVPPMTWGILRPVILLPSDAGEWTPERRRVVLAHELGHVKRNDGLGQLLCQCACGIYWFNPLVWYAAHRLRVEREHACDDIVLRLGAGAADYAEHLLQIARRLNSSLSWTVVSMANPSQLKARLVAILDARTRRQKLSRFAVAALTSLVVCLTVSAAVIQITALASMSVRGFTASMLPAVQPLELSPQIAPTPPVSKISGTAVVAGRVLKADSTEFIGGAAVELRPARDITQLDLNQLAALNFDEDAGVLVVAADEKGEFTFRNVPPGEYTLAATQAGYVRSEYGQKRHNGPGARFTLQAGQELKAIVLPMEETAVISGQIRGPKGLPQANVQVHALKYGYEEGRRVLQAVRVVRTNDEGDYRLYWLPPGQYIVMALPLLGGVEETLLIVGSDGTVGGFRPIQLPNGAPIVLPGESGNVPFYYPGTVQFDAASVLTLKPAEQRTGINLALTSPPVVHVRGTLTNLPPVVAGNAAGPPTRATIRLEPTTPSVLSRGSAPLGMGAVDIQTGAFDIRGVLPGTYNLVASAFGGGRSQTSLYARVPVVVVGGDVDNVKVALAPGFNVTLRLSVEGATDGTQLARLLPLHVMLNGRVAEPGPAEQPGVYVVPQLAPDTYRVRIDRLQNGYVKAARYGDIDILESGVLLDKPPSSAIEITISMSAGAISGTSVSREGKPIANAAVVLVPDAPRRKRADLYKNVMSAADGTFQITGITPGDYKVFSWSDIDTGAWQDPEFLKDYEDQGKPVHIGEGTAATLQVMTLQ